MTDREAMKLALEALEGIHVGNMTPMAEKNWNKAIEALRQALAQPEQSVEPPDYVEPVTYDYHEGWEEGFKAGVEAKAKEQK